MRIVFMGTPEFSVPSLKAMREHFEVVAVYTQPDRSRGRGHKSQPSAVKAQALASGIEVFTPTSLKDPQVQAELRAHDADFFVVIAYGMLLPQEVLEMPKKACVNAHASLLPRHRGASPMQAALLAGDRESGVSTMLMEKTLDTGGILLQRKLSLEGITLPLLHDKLADMSAELLVETLQQFDRLSPRRQDEEKATYSGKIRREDGRIDWRLSAEEIERRYRAFLGWPGSFFMLDGQAVKVLDMEVLDLQAEPATVIKVDAQGIIIGTSNGSILIKRLQFPGKRGMDVSEYLLGNSMEKGIKVD